jgi:hypothetical protein
MLPEITQKYEQGGRPVMKDLIDCLKHLMGGFSTTFIIVDALDELSDKKTTRPDFIKELKDLAKISSARLLVTSRPHSHDIKQIFSQNLQVQIKATEQDVREFLTSRIRNDVNLSCILEDVGEQDQGMLESIVNQILSKAQGMSDTHYSSIFFFPLTHPLGSCLRSCNWKGFARRPIPGKSLMT